ncbi:MAG: histidine kinase [Bacteroidetes bacterium]|nr:histidine kinase [Bacteroidota bacterium]
MSVKSVILAFIMLFPFGELHPQTPPFYHYKTSDGLASSTIYEIIQDRDGFIWFATMNGMSRFDGKRFTTFRTNEGLNSNSIISLVEGPNGELYIGNYEKGINVLRNGKIKNYCSQIDGKSFATSYLLLVPSGKDEQKIFAYRSHGVIFSVTENKGSKLKTHSIITYPVNVNRLGLLANNDMVALTPDGLYSFKKTRLTKILIKGFPDTEAFCLANAGEGSYFIGTRGTIYKVKNNSVSEKYPVILGGNNDVCEILIDRHKNIWFSVMNKGFFLIPCGSKNIIDIGVKMELENTLVNTILEDKEGNIWISTYGKGVFCLNNLYLNNYNENDGLSSNSIYSIEKDKSGKLLIGTFNGLNIFENGRFSHFKTNSTKTLTEYIYNIKKSGNEFYISGAFGETGVKKTSYKGIVLNLFDRPSFCKTADGLFLFGGSGNYILIAKSLSYKPAATHQIFIFGKGTVINRINQIFEDSEKNIWIASTLGLCKITGTSNSFEQWKKSFFPSDAVLNSRINSIIQDNKNTIWFAGDKGIGNYNLLNGAVKTYKSLGVYDLASVNSIVTDNKNRLWIGSMNGLFVFDGTSVKYLNNLTGLPSDEVLTLYYDNKINILYIGTSNGISLLDLSKFDSYNPSPPKVKVTGIKAGDSVYHSYDNLVFKPDQHDVYIELKALNFSSPASVKYEYKINKDWMPTDYDFLNFIALKNGVYTVQIRAKAQNTNWGEPCIISFRVLPRFVETIWFDLIMIVTFMCGLFSVVNWRWRVNNSKVRNELELTERINELKHQALSAMMNPHFIANSLNSVQYLVNSQRYEEANNYIAMMAKLMRKNLDSAGSGFILLSEEIIRLKLYLDLEKLRFQESFSYEIILSEDVDLGSVMIPNMIIQPFVENSLWHGIIDSGNKGLLTVSFSFEDIEIDSLICRSLIIKVTDNGIGITEARKNKKEDHISKGIHIIEERLRLLSTRMHLPQPIMFEDLGSQDNNSRGTEVIISLPPPLYKIVIPGSGPVSSPAV